MGSKKEKELKDFLISERKKCGSGWTNAPVWAMQKSNERIWNPKQKRHWSRTEFGKEFRKRKKKEGK